MPRKKAKKRKGFISDPKDLLCPKVLFKQISVYMDQFKRSQYKLICHLVKCCWTERSHKNDIIRFSHDPITKIPIPWTVIHQYISSFTKEQREELEGAGIIICDETYQKGGKCFFWSMGPELTSKVFASFDVDPSLLRTDGSSSLGSLEPPTPKKKGRSKKNKSLLESEPALIKEGMKMIQRNKIDYNAIERKIRRQLVDADECEEPILKRKLKNKAASNNCYYSVIHCKPNFLVCEDEGTATYIPEYKGSSTGRMYEVGGGMQNMSREMKAVAYGKFLGAGEMFNYDLRSSQVSILLQLGIEMGLSETSCDILREYINNNQAKYEYAEKAGMPAALWKKCFLAMLFGASTVNKEGESVYATIKWTTLHSDAPDLTDEEIEKILTGFVVTAKPFLAVQKEWFQILTKRIKKDEPIRNTIGKVFTENTSNKLSAFLLQGMEAAFIQYLMNISDKYGYEVYSLEHDGLLVSDKIPNEAITEAKEATGFHLAILEEKGFI